MANSGIAINPSLYLKMPFDPVRDLVPISQILLANILIVNNDVPVNNVQELVALARTQPGALTYSSAGTGTTLHLAGELFKSMAKIDIQHVPYRGPPTSDLIAGRISMSFASLPTMLPLARERKVRALAVTSLRRHVGAPDLPTMVESGFPGFEATAWFGLMAPTRTPPAIIQKLHRDTAKILALPECASNSMTLAIRAGRQFTGGIHGCYQSRSPKVGEGDQGSGNKAARLECGRSRNLSRVPSPKWSV